MDSKSTVAGWEAEQFRRRAQGAQWQARKTQAAIRKTSAATHIAEEARRAKVRAVHEAEWEELKEQCQVRVDRLARDEQVKQAAKEARAAQRAQVDRAKQEARQAREAQKAKKGREYRARRATERAIAMAVEAGLVKGA